LLTVGEQRVGDLRKKKDTKNDELPLHPATSRKKQAPIGKKISQGENRRGERIPASWD